ncbi:hypothetical protein [Ohtaekwangia koreensis]|uniref:Annexin n=1 Tax=Ohtaekwangia koreensis TaxID=688867 RepID=A0A1T5J753_9BACT|nr:hypothetical protein [Ohtaekwangia koreensis]SKC47235.1 Annexin [Ohtaekwangia koreensis]
METSDAEKIQNLKTVVIYSTLGVGTATGLFLLGRHFYKKSQANRSEKHSLEEGDPATYAKQLKMAFDNDNYLSWGTDEEAITKVFQELPSKRMFERVQKEYFRMYSRSLNADLEEELSSEEYNNLIRLLNAKK